MKNSQSYTGTSIMQYFPDWAEELEKMRNVRPSSIQYYKEKIECFIRYAGVDDIETLNNLIRFRRAYFRFAAAPLAKSTKSKVWATLSQMGGWLQKNRIIEYNAPKELGKPPKIKYREIEPLTSDDIMHIYRSIKELYDQEKQERNLLIFETFLYSGIRHRELLQLKKVDIGKDYIHVINGKGGKNRFVGIPEWLAKKLHEHIKTYDPQSEFLFPGRTGKMATMRMVSALFSRIKKHSKIHIHPHKLRHTYATQSLIAGMDVHTLQRQLGHEDLKMTLRYVHVSESIRFERVKRYVHYQFKTPHIFEQKITLSEVVRALDSINIRVTPTELVE